MFTIHASRRTLFAVLAPITLLIMALSSRPALAQVAPGYTFTTLVNFNTPGVTGSNPTGDMVLASDGSLYGTTEVGGNTIGTFNNTLGYGTLYHYVPATNTYTTLVNFGTTDAPVALPNGVTLASDGSLYGTSYGGGSLVQGTVRGAGVVYRYSPSAGIYTTLANFDSATGYNSYTGLTPAGDGSFYGTASAGGSSTPSDPNGYGYGTLYRYSPSTNTSTTLVNFGDTNVTGQLPLAEVTVASDGSLYGTTSGGGSSRGGTIYHYVPATGAYTTLLNFFTPGYPESDPRSSSDPRASVVIAADGSLYGTTSSGSDTLYHYIPSTNTFIGISDFGTSSVSARSTSNLVQGSDGSIYGVVLNGNGLNSVYRYNPSTNAFTTLVSFGATNDPFAQGASDLILGGDGSLFLSTFGYDSYQESGDAVFNAGALYRLAPTDVGATAPEPSGVALLIPVAFGGLSPLLRRSRA